MDRRAFIGVMAGGLLAAPLAAEAQPTAKVHRIGILTLEPVPMRFIPFPSILTVPLRPAGPGPCQGRLPNGSDCRRPASRASGYYKCAGHDHDQPVLRADEITGTGRWAVTTPCGGYTKVTLHPTERAARRVLAWLRGVRCGGRCQPARHRVVHLD